jgi:hypothetical protein
MLRKYKMILISHLCDHLTNLISKPIEHTHIPITTIADPFVVHSTLLYINEEGGPMRLLLCATKTRPNPMMIPPMTKNEIAKFLDFDTTEFMQPLSIVTYNSSNTLPNW